MDKMAVFSSSLKMTMSQDVVASFDMRDVHKDRDTWPIQILIVHREDDLAPKLVSAKEYVFHRSSKSHEYPPALGAGATVKRRGVEGRSWALF